MKALREEAHYDVVVGPGERLDASRYDRNWSRMPDGAESLGHGVPMVLKSGNFGSEDFGDRAFAAAAALSGVS